MGSGRAWKNRLFAHSTGWESSCKRFVTGAHLGTVSQTFRSWCPFMLEDILVCSREPNEGEAWALPHLTPSSIEWLISGSILSSSVPINPAHDKILDPWFLFSQSTTRTWKYLCSQTPLVLVSSLLIFTKKPFTTALMYNICVSVWHRCALPWQGQQHLLTSLKLPPPPDFPGLIPGNSVHLLFLCVHEPGCYRQTELISSPWLDLELLIHPSHLYQRKQLSDACVNLRITLCWFSVCFSQHKALDRTPQVQSSFGSPRNLC